MEKDLCKFNENIEIINKDFSKLWRWKIKFIYFNTN